MHWNEWLAMNLDPETLNSFTELEIIAHCLHEMTIVGFEEDEIQEQLDHVKGIKDEYDQLMVEEKDKRTTTLEERIDKSVLKQGKSENKETKKRMRFESIDRDVLIVFYKQPFIDWVNYVYNDDKVECPELLEDDQGNIYLIPEFDTPDEAREYVKENFRDIFENELFGWCEDTEVWPKDLSWEFFERCFHYSWQSVAVDTIETDIQKEVF